MSRRGWLAAVFLGLTVLVMAGCSDSSTQDNSERDEEGNITGGGDVGVFALEIGDCFDDPADGNVSEVEAVPCTESHDNEIIGIFELEGDDFPGDAEITAQATEQCQGDIFTDYIGETYEESTFAVTSLNPTQQSWEEADDREVLCIAYNGDLTPLTESVEAAS